MRPIGELIDLFQVAEEIRLLHHQGGDILRRCTARSASSSVRPAARSKSTGSKADVLIAGDRLRHLRVGRIDGARQQNAPRVRGAIGAHRHQTGFRQRRGAVVQRGVRHFHARERAHHGLIFVDQLQRALTGLGLIRRIGGIEFAARRDGPHRRRDVVLIGARADEIQRPAIARGPLGHEPARFPFRRSAAADPSVPARRRGEFHRTDRRSTARR